MHSSKSRDLGPVCCSVAGVVEVVLEQAEIAWTGHSCGMADAVYAAYPYLRNHSLKICLRITQYNFEAHYALRRAYCVLRSTFLRYITHCVQRIAYYGACGFEVGCVLRIAYCVLRIMEAVFEVDCVLRIAYCVLWRQF